MREIVGALRDQFDELERIVTDLDEGGWQGPSGCAGWSLSDVVLHLAQTNDLATASTEGRFPALVGEFVRAASADDPGGGPLSIDDAAERQVAVERGASGGEVHRRWSRSADALADALAGADPHARLHWVAGELSARTLATTRLAETWIHTGDIAAGLGIAVAPTDRLRHVARLAWRTIPYAFDRARSPLAGPVAFDLTGPDGEPWRFGMDDDPMTVITGNAHELCLVAARRTDGTQTQLRGDGPDAGRVLELIRTYA